jgi:hypothetical protein
MPFFALSEPRGRVHLMPNKRRKGRALCGVYVKLVRTDHIPAELPRCQVCERLSRMNPGIRHCRMLVNRLVAGRPNGWNQAALPHK